MALGPLSEPSSRSTDPSLSPPEGQDRSTTYLLMGDTQITQVPREDGFLRGMVGNMWGPAVRLPASIMGISPAMEAYYRKVFPDGTPAPTRNVMMLGDTVDSPTREEMQTFEDWRRRVGEDGQPIPIRSFLIGNHEVLHAGTSRSGYDFFGLWGLILNLTGPRGLVQDIQLPEAGFRGNLIDKRVLIDLIYPSFWGHEPHPVTLTQSDHHYYSLDGKERRSWEETSRVFDDFWVEEGDHWNALVRYQPDLPGTRESERSLVFLSATQLGRTEDPPVYAVALDSMDYLIDGRELGALQGHVSYLQVRLVEAFMERMKGRDPQTQFVLTTHVPVQEITNRQGSGFVRILSREDVRLVVAAHKHRRDYRDLARELEGVSRRSPLPQVTAASVMDYPNEVLRLRYTPRVDTQHKALFDFEYIGLAESQVPGNSPAVCNELKKIRPHLMIYESALARTRDQRLREFGTPGTSLFRQLDIALNLDEGVITEFGHTHDRVIANDTIPTMVATHQAFFRIFLAVTRLMLHEAGLPAAAYQLGEIYLRNLEHLNRYYERFLAGDFSHTLSGHERLHEPDRHERELEETVYSIKDQVTGLLQEKDMDPGKRKLLEIVEHIVTHLNGTLEDYKYWLERYENNLHSERRDSEMINEANLGSSFHFQVIRKHLEGVPYGSWAWSFLIHAFLESAEQNKVFYDGPEARRKTVPDRLHVEVGPPGETRVTLSSHPKDGLMMEARHWCEPMAVDHANEARLRSVSTLVPVKSRGVEAHWSLRAGAGWMATASPWVAPEFLLSAQGGAEWHLLNDWNRPRLNATLHLEASGHQHSRFSLALRSHIGGGDPWGLVSLGPAFRGGLFLGEGIRPQGYFLSYGMALELLEGALVLQADRVRFHDGNQAWQVTAHSDVLTLGRDVFNIIDRRF